MSNDVTMFCHSGSLQPDMLVLEEKDQKSVYYAAFLVTLRLKLERAHDRFNLIAQVEHLLQSIFDSNPFSPTSDPAVATPEEAEAAHLRALGIPTAYARSFDDLSKFILTNSPTIYDLKVKKAMCVYSAPKRDQCTIHFGEEPFVRRLEGNYHEVAYSAHSALIENRLIEALVNVDRGDIVLVSTPSLNGRDGVVYNRTNGYLEITFKLRDQR